MIKTEFLVDPNMDPSYSLPGVSHTVKQLQEDGIMLADCFYRDQETDVIDNIHCLLGVNVLSDLTPLQTVALGQSIAYEVDKGLIIFGDLTKLTPGQATSIDNLTVPPETQSLGDSTQKQGTMPNTQLIGPDSTHTQDDTTEGTTTGPIQGPRTVTQQNHPGRLTTQATALGKTEVESKHQDSQTNRQQQDHQACTSSSANGLKSEDDGDPAVQMVNINKSSTLTEAQGTAGAGIQQEVLQPVSSPAAQHQARPDSLSARRTDYIQETVSDPQAQTSSSSTHLQTQISSSAQPKTQKSSSVQPQTQVLRLIKSVSHDQQTLRFIRSMMNSNSSAHQKCEDQQTSSSA